MHTHERVLVDAGIKDVLNDKSQSNTENVLSNIKYMVSKCHKFGAKNILKYSLIYTTRVLLEVLEKIHENLSTFYYSYGIY